jgi:hypothetical protein
MLSNDPITRYHDALEQLQIRRVTAARARLVRKVVEGAGSTVAPTHVQRPICTVIRR